VLVASDWDRGDVAGDFRLDGKLSCRNEGIVCRFEVPAEVPVEITARYNKYEEKQPERNRKRMPSQQSSARRLICAMLVLI
jgi:hypothetical protein